MLDLLACSAWALETRYYNYAKERILARLSEGLPALSADEVRPRRYAHADADGYPTMWVTQAGELAGLDPKPEGHGRNLSTAMTGLLAAAARGGEATTSGSKVAVIPVQGSIQKRGGYCSLGTKDLLAHLAAANRDPEISAIVLDIDSPGGQVDGTEEFARAVRSSAKPVVAYIDGLGASAAYWIASQAKSIYLNSETTGYAGSLGVLCMSIDQSSFLEKNGLKVEILRSSRAVDKARLNSVEPLTDERRAQVIADLDVIARTFISAVEAGRAGKLSTKEDVFTGKVYHGADAKKHGLVDGFGSLQDAVNKAASLARAGSGGGSSADTLTSSFSTAWHFNSKA
jgi:signal peptide peptidase SppA